MDHTRNDTTLPKSCAGAMPGLTPYSTTCICDVLVCVCVLMCGGGLTSQPLFRSKGRGRWTFERYSYCHEPEWKGAKVIK